MTDLERGKSNLQAALLAVSKDYLENLELAPEEDVSFSPKLERKMERLLKSREKSYWKLINSPLKKVFAACLVAAVLAGTQISCAPIREPIFEFFTEVYEKFTEFFFGNEKTNEASEVITEIHTLTYVPEGYELVEDMHLTNENRELSTIWENDDGNKIFFYQNLLVSKTLIDTEDAEVKVLLNDLQIAMIQKDKVIYTFWNDEQYAYTLIVQDISEDEIVKIINSFI